jgi:F0F1-type ATP synthase membrane subunit a
MAFIFVPLETISYSFRAVSLGVRLWVNMLAGHTLLHILTGVHGCGWENGCVCACVSLARICVLAMLGVCVCVCMCVCVCAFMHVWGCTCGWVCGLQVFSCLYCCYH